MTPKREGFEKMKDIDQSVCLANGKLSGITGMGDERINICEGQQQNFIVRENIESILAGYSTFTTAVQIRKAFTS